MKQGLKLILGLVLFSSLGTLFAGGGGSAPKPLEGSYPIVLSHGMFGWGDENGGVVGIID